MVRSEEELLWMISTDVNPNGLSSEELEEIKKSFVPSLLKKFESSRPLMGSFIRKQEALYALSNIRDKRIAESLVRFLKNPSPREFTIPALKALAKYHDYPEAKEIFDQYLYSKNAQERRYAAIGLYRLGDPSGIEHLIHEIERFHPILQKELPTYQREYMAIALGKLGDKRAIDPLFCNLIDLTWSAALALVDIGQRGGGGEVREMIIDRGTKILDTTSDQDSPESLSTAYILCMLGDEKGLPPMEKMLDDEKFQRRRDYAIRALAGLKTERALRVLARYLKESDVVTDIVDSFLYRTFEDDPLLEAIGVDIEEVKRKRIEVDHLILSDIARKIEKETLVLEANRRDEGLKQMAKEALSNFRLKYAEKGLDNPQSC